MNLACRLHGLTRRWAVWLAILAAFFAVCSPGARAQESAASAGLDLSLSGFGTVSWARSDQRFAYQRFVTDQGTFRRDSLLGAQLDARFGQTGLGATLQGRVVPSLEDDGRYDARLAWAFVSWRPDNNWLTRLGRLRVPLYMNSETTEVGVTFDLAHQPGELYTTTLLPSTDFNGLSISRSLSLEEYGDITLDLYAGNQRSSTRMFWRDDIDGFQSRGPFAVPLDMAARGLVLNWRNEADDQQLRVGFHHISTQIVDPHQFLNESFPWVEPLPGVGYYKTNSMMPGPELVQTRRFDYRFATLGVSIPLPSAFKLIAEASVREAEGSRMVPRFSQGYLALQRRTGAWTPYAVWAWLKSADSQLAEYVALNSNRVPPSMAFAPLLNASQRAGADQFFAYDQHSLALGTSYRIDPRQLLKFEVQQVDIGKVSQLVDTPAGEDSGGRTIRIVTLGYSFVF